jgi:sulfate adenylyltransferase subunit 1 (EFTu-like GTPase family)
LDYLPVSAATGDNVVKPSRKMQWHAGAPLLTQLEAVKATSDRGARALRFPVQRVVGVHPNFRGYAGTIVSGAVRLGDPVVALPSRRRTSIRNILDGRGARDFALAGTPVTLELADDIGLNRGDLLAAPEERPQSARQLEVNMIWMSRTPLRSGKPYWVKQTTNWVHAFADVEYRLALDGSRSEGATGLQLNEIGGVSLELSRPLVVDTYKQNRQTGSLIVVDPETGETAAAGMVI